LQLPLPTLTARALSDADDQYLIAKGAWPVGFYFKILKSPSDFVFLIYISQIFAPHLVITKIQPEKQIQFTTLRGVS